MCFNWLSFQIQYMCCNYHTIIIIIQGLIFLRFTFTGPKLELYLHHKREEFQHFKIKHFKEKHAFE